MIHAVRTAASPDPTFPSSRAVLGEYHGNLRRVSIHRMAKRGVADGRRFSGSCYHWSGASAIHPMVLRSGVAAIRRCVSGSVPTAVGRVATTNGAEGASAWMANPAHFVKMS